MSPASARFYLANHFLIAMPTLEDEGFARSVVFLCEHSEQGAMGVVINKPTSVDVRGLFDRLDLPLGRADLLSSPVFYGGPLQTECGFVLHEAMSLGPQQDQQAYNATVHVKGSALEMTSSRDVLEAMSVGAGPRRVLITLGYSAWGEGQLEAELAANAWLTVAADPAIIFDAPVQRRYDYALALLGVRSGAHLCAGVGHA